GAFLVARVVYVPLYALGIPYLRSLVWMVGFIATILMLLAALL
ncbi:MAG: MAPEG family protein, partial [Pseudomonadota bacterium]